MSKCTKKKNMKYVPYMRQIKESRKDNIDKTLGMGKCAPMVPTEKGIQRTEHNLLTVYENIDRGDRAPMVPTNRETQNNLLYENIDREEHGFYTKNGLKLEFKHKHQDCRPNAIAQVKPKDVEVTFGLEGAVGHN